MHNTCCAIGETLCLRAGWAGIFLVGACHAPPAASSTAPPLPSAETDAAPLLPAPVPDLPVPGPIPMPPPPLDAAPPPPKQDPPFRRPFESDRLPTTCVLPDDPGFWYTHQPPYLVEPDLRSAPCQSPRPAMRPRPERLLAADRCAPANANATFHGLITVLYDDHAHLVDTHVWSRCGDDDARHFRKSPVGRCILEKVRFMIKPPCDYGIEFQVDVEWRAPVVAPRRDGGA